MLYSSTTINHHHQPPPTTISACGEDCLALGPVQALFFSLASNASASTAASATAKLMSRSNTAETATGKDALLVAKIDNATLSKFLMRIHGLMDKGPRALLLGKEIEKPPPTPITPAVRIGGGEVLMLDTGGDFPPGTAGTAGTGGPFSSSLAFSSPKKIRTLTRKVTPRNNSTPPHPTPPHPTPPQITLHTLLIYHHSHSCS